MHAEMSELMQQALDGELSELERRRLQSHLDGCADCALEWRTVQHVHAQLASAPQRAPAAGFETRVMQRIAAAQRAPGASAGRIALFSAASIALLGFVFALSPFDALMSPDSWVALVPRLVALATSVNALMGIALTLAGVVGDAPLFAIALLALALTLWWLRLVAGPAAFNSTFLSSGGTE